MGNKGKETLEKIAAANRKADPWADALCDWMKSKTCTTCLLFGLFAVGFIAGVVFRGLF